MEGTTANAVGLGASARPGLFVRLEEQVRRAGSIAAAAYDRPEDWARANRELTTLHEDFTRDSNGTPSAALAQVFRLTLIEFNQRRRAWNASWDADRCAAKQTLVVALERLSSNAEEGAMVEARRIRDEIFALGYTKSNHEEMKRRVRHAFEVIRQADRARTKEKRAADRARVEQQRAAEKARIELRRSEEEATRQEAIDGKVAAKRRVIELVTQASRAPNVPACADAVRALKLAWREIGLAGPENKQLGDEYAAAVKVFWDAEKAATAAAAAAAAALPPQPKKGFWPFRRKA